MKRFALWFIPAALLAGEARYARLGDIEGRPEVQLQPGAAWAPAARNTLVLDGAWVRTEAGARAEIELDEGSAFRLDSGALCELSDYTRLSTGQRVTLLSLDRGVAYFTGASEGGDSLIMALPGAQVTIRRGARLRLEAGDSSSQIAVIEGTVLFSSPAAELELQEGQLVRVEPANPSRFFLYREIPALEADKWSEARDKALATASAGHVASPRFGLADLDAWGSWLDTEAWGTVWKPKIAAGWAPFRTGKWMWYDGVGYTWISAEPWGWLPYHYGRWAMDENAGWVWVPGKDNVFSPGDVYWLRGAKLAGWGPLAPSESWDARNRPQLYLNSSSTFAAFVPEMREIDPAGFAPPREPLLSAGFTAALPSPALPAARLEVQRPVLRAGSTRLIPRLTGVTYDPGAGSSVGTPGSENPADAANAGTYVNTTIIQPAPPPPVVVVTPPPEPPEAYYPVPVYTGIVVVNPPERDRGPGRGRAGRRNDSSPAQRALPSGEQPKAAASHTPPPAPPAVAERPRAGADQRRHEPAPSQPQRPIAKPSEEPKAAPRPPTPAPAPTAEKHVDRGSEPVRQAERPAARSEENRSEGEQRRPSSR